MTKIRETAKVARRGPGRILLTLITPGTGSSGDYAPEVLATAAEEKAFPRGTFGFVNHASETEIMERPEGDLRNLIWVTLEDAYVDDTGGLVAETRVLSAWADFVEEAGEFIGASISAAAVVRETAEGRVVERIIPSPFNSVDAVTVAGRGGKVSEILESARVIESRSIVNEATASDIRVWLQATIRTAHDDYAWVADHDETYVYYEIGDKYYRQAYELTGVNVTLSGDPVEVRRRVEYDPVILPATPAGVTENKKEDASMATTQIEEAELTQLRESAGRVTQLETELAAEKEARAKEAADRATEAKDNRVKEAKRIVAEAFGEDAPALYTRLAESAATPEDFDAEAFRTEVQEAAAKTEADQGAGTPRGMGTYTPRATESKTISDDELIAALHGKA